jgi:Tol biopolymer transport system component
MSHTPDFSRYLNVRSAYGPSISHDGASLAFLTDITGVAEAWRTPLREGSSAPHWPDQLTFGGERISRVAYAPNDDRLLLCGDTGGSELTQLYLLEADGVTQRHIAGAPNTICQFGA